MKKLSTQTWDWSKIPEEELLSIAIPKGFLWGSVSCEYQVSGAANCSENNWAHWEKLKKAGLKDTIRHGQQSGSSADHWNRYKEDIQLMKKLGLTAYRFSLDWGMIEPAPGNYNQAAIDHYIDLCHELKKNSITPMVTLLHFTYPQWFELKGGFEKEENIPYFVEFSKKMFLALKHDVKYWCIMNEPPIITLMGYIFGDFPPGKKNFYHAGLVLKNLLEAHCTVYNSLKAEAKHSDACFGIAHSSLKLVPRNWWNIIVKLVCIYMNYIKNKAMLNFFKHGVFTWYTPFGKKIKYVNKSAPKCIDWFGVNYYSRLVIGIKDIICKTGTCFPGEVMTDMPFAVHPEGFYEAIHEASEFNVPIYITENGIADGKDDRRELFIKRHLYVLSKSIQDGYDVRGYFYWSLTDNFEWNEGFLMNFGLYQVDFATQERKLREGARCYKHIIANATIINEAS